MTMAYTLMLRGCILLYLHVSVINCLPYDEDIVDVKVLNVGEELKQETLPLQMGHRRYQLHGLKASMWYEVKISYPASIPASFSLQLQRDKSYIGSNMKRRLLNTEKLIFKADYNLLSEHSEVHVLLTVEPGGVVAKPHVQERQYVIFNIVCDELSLVSPPKVWLVVILAFLCLGVALTIPYFLPPFLLPKNHSSQFGDLASSKEVTILAIGLLCGDKSYFYHVCKIQDLYTLFGVQIMAGTGSSMLYSFLLFIIVLSLQEMYRAKLASSELFTILGGLISSLIFLVLLTFIGNFQESCGLRTGWGAVLLAESVALVAASTVHRVCITTCFLFSAGLLYEVNKLSGMMLQKNEAKVKRH